MKMQGKFTKGTSVMLSVVLLLCMLVTFMPIPEKVSAATAKEFLFEVIDKETIFKKVKGVTGKVHLVRNNQIVASYPVVEYQAGYSDTGYKAVLDADIVQEDDKVIFELYCDGYDDSITTMYNGGDAWESMEHVLDYLGAAGTYLGSWMNDGSKIHTAYVNQKTIEHGPYDSWSKLLADLNDVMGKRTKGNHEFRFSEALAQKLKNDGILKYDSVYSVWQIDMYQFFDFYGNQLGIHPAGGDYFLNTKQSGTLPQGNEYSITYDMTYQNFITSEQQEAAFNAKLASLFAPGGELAHVKGLSDSEKVVACMKYINTHVSGGLSYDSLKHSAYYALCEGGGTCQAVASLLYRMLREVGVANRILLGQDAAAHTYNIVLIDGKYYYCDPSTTNVVLKGSNSFKPALLQEQFLTADYQNNIVAKISPTDYPLPSSGGATGNGGGSGATGTNPGNGSNTPSGDTPSKEDTPTGDEEKIEYEVLDGEDSTYYTSENNENGLSLRAAGAFDKFVSVEVDGTPVEAKHYTVKEGSTIITFTKEFMDSLGEGEHEVKFNFTDGYANANIVIAKEKGPESTLDTEDVTEDNTDTDTQESTEVLDDNKKDGNDSFVWVWIVVAILVVAAGAAGIFYYITAYHKKR